MNEQATLEGLTPGLVYNIPTAAIIVGDRVRHDYGDIEWLSEDIEVRGLLQPLVLSPRGKLIAGGRRLRAVQHLDWPDVPCYIFRGTNALEDRASEIAEFRVKTCVLTQEQHFFWSAVRLAVTPT